ncbi:hypothetical protein SAMN05444161_3156 [Rhizobiales bacterium GAS191]|nr:hypothetical protein SAMN05444161_3156 [Rhizobiales bacterium GAS191]
MSRSRTEKFERSYGIHAATVLHSIAMVAVAGRSRYPARIKAGRARHYKLMASLP